MLAPPTGWTLHDEPYRHYKATINGKPTWTIDKRRIASVTTVLGGHDNLAGWAASQALTAAEAAVNGLGLDEYAPGWPRTSQCDEDGVLLDQPASFAELAYRTGSMPDQVRDIAAARGTEAHTYLAARLIGVPRPYTCLPYGYRAALEEWLREWKPVPVSDERGLRIERAVGDHELAVAGTYDAQVCVGSRVHRIDLKSSRTITSKHFAQLAAYERCARACGEGPSDRLTVVQIDGTGHCRTYTIATYSDAHTQALREFDAHLTIYRGSPAVAKLLKETNTA